MCRFLYIILFIPLFSFGQHSFWFDQPVYPEVDVKDLPFADSLHTRTFHDMETYRQLLFRYINWERMNCDLPPLQRDSILMKNSQDWANYMARWNKYKHTGKNVVEIINKGHNMLQLLHREVAYICVGSWMDSEPHRDAILDPDLKSIGIGCAEGKNDNFNCNTYFIVQFEYE